MDIYKTIQSQYLAGLEMLRKAVEACPDSVWDAEKDRNATWLVAYHAIFYTHLYLQPAHADFVPWEKSREQLQFMGDSPEGAGDAPESGEAYTRAELQDYLELCRQQVLEVVPRLDLHGPSGFEWIPLNKLELQFYNLRHLMQHTGELMERLWADAGIEIAWVGRRDVD